MACDQNSQHTSSIHEGKKLLGNKEKTVFRCLVFNKQFDRKEKLKRHMTSVHDEKKPLYEICPYYFAQKAGLTMHIKSDHEKRKMLTCNACNKNFIQNAVVPIGNSGYCYLVDSSHRLKIYEFRSSF